ncbi:MAG: FliH/SctL family protein [Phycisphaerae bacterium]|jgi:flagellar assembly protein FliH|nr:FliH/SctL family protein [Phycisphaerae bacterium]
MTRIIKKARRVPSDDRPVMKLTDIAAQANALILDARKTAAKIKAEARANVELAKRQARKQGYDAGFAEGRKQGLTDGAREGGDQARASIAGESKQLADVAGAILATLDEAGDRPYQFAADEVLNFALDLSSKIVGRLARTDISVARTNLIKAMRLAHAEGEIIVAVNPLQLQALSSDFAEFVEVIDASARARLVADRQVAPGGVKITTARGVIDATVETQLDKVASALTAGGPFGSPEVSGKYEPVPHLRIIDSDVST